MSNLILDLPICNGTMLAEIPRITNIFKRLLPRIFPIAMPVVPDNAAEILIAASGALVPKATIVSPND